MAIFALEKTGWRKTPEHDTTDPGLKEHINALYEQIGIRNRV